MIRTLLAWPGDAARFLLGNPVALALSAGGLVAGGLAGWPVGDAAYTYMWRDPGMCDDCHVHDYANEAWGRSVHASLTTCHDCHHVPVRHYPRNLYMMVFDKPQGAEDIHTPDVETVICATCHTAGGAHGDPSGPMTAATRDRVVKIDDSPLHRVHLDAEREEPIACLDCHGGAEHAPHRFEPTTSNCLECHAENELSGSRLATVDCRDCHGVQFLGAEAGTASAGGSSPH
jgi:hypothetical protein